MLVDLVEENILAEVVAVVSEVLVEVFEATNIDDCVAEEPTENVIVCTLEEESP